MSGHKAYNPTEVFRCTATGNNCRFQGFASNFGDLEHAEGCINRNQ